MQKQNSEVIYELQVIYLQNTLNISIEDEVGRKENMISEEIFSDLYALNVEFN